MIRDLFYKGITQQITVANNKEKEKIGKLRGGNTGMMSKDGRIIGTCAALTYLRMNGINGLTVTPEKELMFAGGRLNEDHWLSVLQEGYPEGIIKCEEDIPTCWETDQGIKVTGRPDIVLCDKQENLLCGIELKQVMSANTAYTILIKKEPMLKHLMQAAHYMWQLDCPFELWYTNRNSLDMPGWMEFRPFPKPSLDSSTPINYRYYRYGETNARTGKPIKHKITKEEYYNKDTKKQFAQASKITPFVQGFELKLVNGQLFFKDAMIESDKWIETIVNIDDIKRFYNYIGELEQIKKVPSEVLNLNAFGKPYGWKYSDYTDFGELDPAFHVGKDLHHWALQVRHFINMQSNK